MPSAVMASVALWFGKKPGCVSENVAGPPLGAAIVNVPSAATVVLTFGDSVTETTAPSSESPAPLGPNTNAWPVTGTAGPSLGTQLAVGSSLPHAATSAVRIEAEANTAVRTSARYA